MSEKPSVKITRRNGDTLVVDKQYIRTQANVALKAFFSPLSGVYEAVVEPISPPGEAPPSQTVKQG